MGEKKLVIHCVAPHHDYVGARRNSVISKTWLKERQEILQKIKGQVRLYLGEEPPDVVAYANAYKKDLGRPWQASDWEKVDVCLQQVNVVFGGDFHPFAQAQRSHLRVMRRMVSERSLILCLECLFSRDQEVVDRFMAGEISEGEFLEATQWDMLWGFPWQHYKPLFDFCKKNNISIVALNKYVDERSAETLKQRDLHAAEIIYKQATKNPESLLYTLYGDLHIAQEHLPKHLKALGQGGLPLECAVLYLNSEHIYFDLAAQGLEGKVEVVSFSDRQFCILSSPPWVKWHSYLMFLEENFDVGLAFEDFDNLDDEDDDWDCQVDHTDHVSDLVKMICAAIGVELKTDAIEVYSLNDPQALVVVEKTLSKQDFSLAHSLIQADRSFYVPQEGFFYLSKSTVNHAASLAGQYVHAQIGKRQKLTWDYPRDFKQSIWLEAMAFFLSKFVNPKRKSQTMSDLKKQLQAFDKEDQGREPLLLALDQKMLELLAVYSKQERAQAYRPREKSSYVHAARFMGEILGDRYFLLYQKQILGIDSIRALLQQPIDSPDFDKFYLNQLKSLDRLEMEGSQIE